MKKIILFIIFLILSNIIYAQFPVTNQSSYIKTINGAVPEIQKPSTVIQKGQTTSPSSKGGNKLPPDTTKKGQPSSLVNDTVKNNNSPPTIIGKETLKSLHKLRLETAINKLWLIDTSYYEQLVKPTIALDMFNKYIDSTSLVEAKIYTLELVRDKAGILPSCGFLRGYKKSKDRFVEPSNTIAYGFFTFIYSNSNLSTLQNAVIQTSGIQTSVYTELVSDCLGPVRLSLSSIVNTTKDTASVNEAKEQLMKGGGNAVGSCELPVFYFNEGFFLSYVSAIGRVAGDLPVLGSNVPNPSSNANIGLQYYQDFSSDEKNFNFFFLLQISKIVGLTPAYYSNLNIPANSSFTYASLNFGVTLFTNFRISFSYPIFASYSSLLKVPINYGGQMVPTISQ